MHNFTPTLATIGIFPLECTIESVDCDSNEIGIIRDLVVAHFNNYFEYYTKPFEECIKLPGDHVLVQMNLTITGGNYRGCQIEPLSKNYGRHVSLSSSCFDEILTLFSSKSYPTKMDYIINLEFIKFRRGELPLCVGQEKDTWQSQRKIPCDLSSFLRSKYSLKFEAFQSVLRSLDSGLFDVNPKKLFEIVGTRSWPLLEAAIMSGRVDLFEKSIALGQKLDWPILGGKNSWGMVEAAVHAPLSTFLELVKRGLDITIRDRDGDPLVARIAGEGWPETLTWLLDHGTDPETRDEKGRTLLLCALAKGHFVNFKILLLRGADVLALDRWSKNAIMVACGVPTELEVMKRMLSEAGCNGWCGNSLPPQYADLTIGWEQMDVTYYVHNKLPLKDRRIRFYLLHEPIPPGDCYPYEGKPKKGKLYAIMPDQCCIQCTSHRQFVTLGLSVKSVDDAQKILSTIISPSLLIPHSTVDVCFDRLKFYQFPEESKRVEISPVAKTLGITGEIKAQKIGELFYFTRWVYFEVFFETTRYDRYKRTHFIPQVCRVIDVIDKDGNWSCKMEEWVLTPKLWFHYSSYHR